MKIYDSKLDRMIFHDWPGVVGSGMHGFVMDEIEVGARAAMLLDEPDQCWWELHGAEVEAALTAGVECPS